MSGYLDLPEQRVYVDGQQALVPGARHSAPTQKPAVVNRMILDFLRKPGDERPLALDR